MCPKLLVKMCPKMLVKMRRFFLKKKEGRDLKG
jgi:hypothetical protein